jgi:hypothetical protein
MGGIKIISPVPKPLSTKEFPAMTGGIEMFLDEEKKSPSFAGISEIMCNFAA